MSKVTAPADAAMATSVQKVLDGMKAPEASSSNTVELVYAISK